MTDNEIYLRSEAEKGLREADYQRKRAERFERECKALRDLSRRLLLRLAWADELSGGGLLDARMREDARALGIGMDEGDEIEEKGEY